MMNRRLTKAEKNTERLRKADVNKRFMSPNLIARKFCWENGMTVYASAQAGTANKVKVFRQRGENFLPISNTLYDQGELDEVKEYCYAIDKEYERIFLKMKNKVK